MLTTTEKLVEKELVKQQQVHFITIQSSSTVKEVRDKFHSILKASLQGHPFRYKGVNLGEITQVQK